MIFTDFLNQCWKDHATKTEIVAAGISDGIGLISEENHINQLANLIIHLFGEHLGRFDEGIELLEKLEQSSLVTMVSTAVLNCAKVTLAYSAGMVTDWSGFTLTEKVRIYCGAAGINNARNEIGQAEKDFRSALNVATELSETDPANRLLAICGNNLACTLEEKTSLSADEEVLMLLAAHAGRKYWQIAGTWLEVERAEYRLAQSYLKARDLINSIKHANLCLTICETNNAGALEFFFAYESIALVEHKMRQSTLRSLPQMQKYFAELSQSDKEWCSQTLTKIESLESLGS